MDLEFAVVNRLLAHQLLEMAATAATLRIAWGCVVHLRDVPVEVLPARPPRPIRVLPRLPPILSGPLTFVFRKF